MKQNQMIKHHLTDKSLMAYSAGQLSEAFNLVGADPTAVAPDRNTFSAGGICWGQS